MPGLSLNTNISVLSGLGAMHRNQNAMSTSMLRLITGSRINRAADDPAGMIAGEHFAVEAKKLGEMIKGLEFETTRLAASEGAHSAVGDMLIDLEGVLVAAANTGASTPEEREAYQMEADSIIDAIDYIAQTTRFNGRQVLEGYTSSNIGVLEFRSGGEFNLIDGDREGGQSAIDEALSWSRGVRGGIGLRMKQIDSEYDRLKVELEGVLDARSKIMDTDYASEVSELVRSQALRAAAQFTVQFSMQQRAETVLGLLPKL